MADAWDYVYALVDGEVVVGRLIEQGTALHLPGIMEPLRGRDFTVIRGVERPAVFVHQDRSYSAEMAVDRVDAHARFLLAEFVRVDEGDR